MPTSHNDLVISAEVSQSLPAFLALDRLSFDGYRLSWHGSAPSQWPAFSGQADESARESEKDRGPIPQGKFAIDPANIEEFPEDPAWGRHRVRIEPYRETVDRMANCFRIIRSGFYVHGGAAKGTIGCIELNSDSDEDAFFAKLKAYNRKIELEVRYVAQRERKYEDSRCPY